MTQPDFQIILEIVIVLLGLYLAFVKSYFQEKGKNLATKEDIEGITQKIEKVKSDIGILTQKKINLSTEKQNSLLDFNSKYTAWLSYILDVGLIGHTDPATIYIEKVKEKLDQLFYDVAISEAKFDVFFNSAKELIELKNTIKLKTIELSNHLDLYLYKAGGETDQISIVNKLPNIIPDNSYKMNELEKHYKLRDTIHQEFQVNKLTMFKLLSPLNYQLAEIISNKVHDFEVN